MEYFESYGLLPIHRDIQDFFRRPREGFHSPHVYQYLNTDMVNTPCIIDINDIEAVKPSQTGYYPGKARLYNEIVMSTPSLKDLS